MIIKIFKKSFSKWLILNVLFVQALPCLAIPALEPNTIKPLLLRDYYLKNLPAIKDYQSWRITRYPYTPPRLAPEEGLVLVDIKGSGFLTHAWWTGRWQSEWIQFYFDGEQTPSIEGYCSQLFGSDTVSQPIDRIPVPLKILPTDGRNCYIPMPYHTSLKIVMVNKGKSPIEDTYLIFDGIRRSPNTVPACTLKYSADKKQFFYTGKDANDAIDPLGNNKAENPCVGSLLNTTNEIELMPGQEKDILTVNATAMIKQFSIKTDMLQELQLRIKYEDSNAYAVNCPADKFFGKLNSLVLENNNDQYTCYLPMPFSKSWKMTLKNKSGSAIKIKAQAAYEKMKAFPKNYTYLHAAYNEGVGQDGREYQLMEAAGRGHFIGMLLYHTASPVKPTDHSGADMIYGDAQTESPFALRAIGGEDYFCAAFFGENYATPHVGATPTYMDGGMRYRFHWESPVPFTKSLNVDFCIFSGNSYQSVAFWYQDSPAPASSSFQIPWLCIGPFNAYSPQGDMLSMVFEPENKIIKDKTYNVEVFTPVRSTINRTAQWKERSARGGFVDFNAENTRTFGYPPGVLCWAIDTISYAVTTVKSSEKKDVTLVIGHDDPIEIFLNGKSIVKLAGLSEFKTEEIQTRLAAGTNQILVKSGNRVHPVTFIWDGFSLLIKDKHGSFLPKGCFTLDF
jgi:hypothetical protein